MPNTNKKKFDFTILLASLSIVLVICCAVVCCVIGIGSDNQVAQAYTDEEVGPSNLEFTVDEGFYIRNMYSLSAYQINNIINYFYYFIPGFMNPEVYIEQSYEVGGITMAYTGSDDLLHYAYSPIYIELNQLSYEGYNYVTINVYISNVNDLYFFDFTYEYEEEYVDEFIIEVYGTRLDNYPNNYYVHFNNHPEYEGSFANQLAVALVGDPYLIYSIDSLTFQFDNFANLGIFISSNEQFSYAPVVIPQGVYDDDMDFYYNMGYDDGYYGGYDEGFDSGYDQGIVDGENSANENNQAIIDDLQAEIDRLTSQVTEYETLLEGISWFSVFNSSYEDLSLINIGDYRSIHKEAQISTAGSHITFTSGSEDIHVAVGIILPRVYSSGTRFRFSYSGISSSLSGMAIVNTRLGYLNSAGVLIDLQQLATSQSSYFEFTISEDINTFVLYSPEGNFMEIENLRFEVYSFDEQLIYGNAYDDGYVAGVDSVDTQRYYDNGFQAGRIDGINSSNNYSFFALFSSVLDAPLQVIIGSEEKPGMLNFYIPGLDINIAPFLLSLFTVALVITVIRFILARAS